MQEYNGMKVGDIISTYNNGFHQLDRIEDHPCSAKEKMFIYHQVATNDGRPKIIRKELKCSSVFCAPAEAAVDKWIKFNEDALVTLKKFKSTLKK